MVPSTGYNKTRTAVFISGTGSNLKSLIKFSKTNKSPISIDFIVSNNPKAKGLNFAKIYNIKPGLTGIGSIIFRDEEVLLNDVEIRGDDTWEFYKKKIYPFKGKIELW